MKKNFFLTATLLLSLSFFSCKDSKENVVLNNKEVILEKNTINSSKRLVFSTRQEVENIIRETSKTEFELEKNNQ